MKFLSKFGFSEIETSCGSMFQFARALFHSDCAGVMSEQFNHVTGIMQGAEELTWSHNAFMTAMMRCNFLK